MSLAQNRLQANNEREPPGRRGLVARRDPRHSAAGVAIMQCIYNITGLGTLSAGSALSPSAGVLGNFFLNSTASGTLTNYGAATYFTPMNGIIAASDSIASASTLGAKVPGLLDVEDYFGGSTVNDGRDAISAVVELTSSTVSNTYKYYGAINTAGIGAANDGGTSGAPAGTMYGAGFLASIRNNATYWFGLSGAEIDMDLESGSSAANKYGLGIIQWPTDAVKGSNVDAAILLANNPGAVGWSYGILLHNLSGQFPLASTATLIGSTAGTISNGIDLSAVTVTNDILKWSGGTYYLSGAGVASLATASFAVGATSSVQVGKWSVGAYGMLSFNASFTSGSALGIGAGASGDPDMYLVAPTGGYFVFRSNGATTNTMTIGATGGTATKYACGDANNNLFFQSAAC